MNPVVDDAVRSGISRVVALLTPLFASGLGALAYWLQDKVGIDLQVDPAVAAAFVGTIVAGAMALGWKWLENRGKYEITALAKLLEETVAAGHAVQGGTGEPRPTLGATSRQVFDREHEGR